MKKAYLVKTIILMLLSSVFALVCLGEYNSIEQNLAEYMKVYHFSEDSPIWKYRSISNYKTWNLILFSILSLYLIVNILFLIKRRKYLKYTIIGMDIIALFWFIFSVINWYKIGFDHP